MTEFTSEFIAEQRTLAVALPKRLSVGVVHKNHVNINQNFDTKPIPTKLNVMDVNIFSTMPETCLTAQSICDACNHYPEALDHIEQLQKRVQELEVQLKSKDIIINNQQGRLNYYATKDLLGDKNE
jgi:hypothetical protein